MNAAAIGFMAFRHARMGGLIGVTTLRAISSASTSTLVLHRTIPCYARSSRPVCTIRRMLTNAGTCHIRTRDRKRSDSSASSWGVRSFSSSDSESDSEGNETNLSRALFSTEKTGLFRSFGIGAVVQCGSSWLLGGYTMFVHTPDVGPAMSLSEKAFVCVPMMLTSSLICFGEYEPHTITYVYPCIILTFHAPSRREYLPTRCCQCHGLQKSI